MPEWLIILCMLWAGFTGWVLGRYGWQAFDWFGPTSQSDEEWREEWRYVSRDSNLLKSGGYQPRSRGRKPDLPTTGSGVKPPFDLPPPPGKNPVV